MAPCGLGANEGPMHRLVSIAVPTFLALGLAACAAAPVGVTVPSAADVPPPVAKEDARQARPESPAASEKDEKKESLDPLSVGGALEASAVPNVVKTPAKELRPLTRVDLDQAMKVLEGAGSPDAAVKKLVARLGKPTWTENDKKRVWIAKEGKACHRFSLENDGQADIETAPITEWRMLSANAKQNACTGEIKKGDLGGTGN